jgi:hypothetical protein
LREAIGAFVVFGPTGNNLAWFAKTFAADGGDESCIAALTFTKPLEVNHNEKDNRNPDPTRIRLDGVRGARAINR